MDEDNALEDVMTYFSSVTNVKTRGRELIMATSREYMRWSLEKWLMLSFICNNTGRGRGHSSQTYSLQPEAVQVWSSLLLVERDQPATATLVPLVLPHGFNAVLQQRFQLATRSPNQQHTISKTASIYLFKKGAFSMISLLPAPHFYPLIKSRRKFFKCD